VERIRLRCSSRKDRVPHRRHQREGSERRESRTHSEWHVRIRRVGADSGASSAITVARRGRARSQPAQRWQRAPHRRHRSSTEHISNHAETTLKNSGSYIPLNINSTYTISFRARWLAGCNLLNTRLYFNRLAKKTTLFVPAASGTPGAQNSTVRRKPWPDGTATSRISPQSRRSRKTPRSRLRLPIRMASPRSRCSTP
jgi:hypothetical protein